MEPVDGTIELLLRLSDENSEIAVFKGRTPDEELVHPWVYDLRVGPEKSMNFIWVDADPTDLGANEDNDNQSAGTSDLELGCWNHISVTWTAGMIAYYVNGVPRGVDSIYQEFVDSGGINRGLAFTQSGVLNVAMRSGTGEIASVDISGRGFDIESAQIYPVCP